MDTEKEKRKIAVFLKAGLIGLSALVLAVTGFYYLPKSIAVMSGIRNQKELPIYCVDRKDKKVALSFDAAWAEGCLMEQKNTDKYYRKVCLSTLCQ